MYHFFFCNASTPKIAEGLIKLVFLSFTLNPYNDIHALLAFFFYKKKTLSYHPLKRKISHFWIAKYSFLWRMVRHFPIKKHLLFRNKDLPKCVIVRFGTCSCSNRIPSVATASFAGKTVLPTSDSCVQSKESCYRISPVQNFYQALKRE